MNEPRWPENSTLIASWGDWMSAMSMSERTQELYVYAVHRLLSRQWTRGKCLLELSESDITAHLAGFGLNAHSKTLHLRAARCFYRWATGCRLLAHDPTAILARARKPPRPPQQPFTVDELRRLLIAAAWRDPRRAWAILACFALGTRRTEFAMIRTQDISWSLRKVSLRVTKGSRQRDVDLSPLAEVALRELLASGRPNRYGTILGVKPVQFGHWVAQAATDCGFPPGRKRRAHTLRASYASYLEHHGVPGSVIQAQLGHESLSTTSQYFGLYDGDGARAVRVLGADFGRNAGGRNGDED